MNDKDLYKQKAKAELDALKADIDKLKARTMGAKADAQLHMNELIAELDAKYQSANEQLSELSAAGDEAWASIKEGAEEAWGALKKSMHEVMAKFKD